MKPRRIRVGVAVLGVAAASIALSGCSSSIEQRANATPPHVVSVEGPITDHDADLLSASWVPWEKANHITILYTGTPDFESSIAVEASQNNAPDLAIIAQPGLVVDLAKHQLLQPEPASVLAEAKKNFPASWVNYTATGGTNYGAPLMASVNGWVFYSPKQFAQWGVSVPKTWSQLLQLTDTIQQKTGSAPWCDGFSQGATSGENGVNWIDDLVLRDAGPTVYDQWVSHQIPFTDKHIQKAFSDLSSLLLNPKYVNADLGDVKSIDVSTTPEVASALESGKCALTHQPSSFVNQLTTSSGAAATISPNGDYWAFPLPSFDGKSTPVTGGGYFVAAFSSSADTIKVQQYLASVDWAKARVKLGGAISPDLSIPASLDSTPLEQASTKLLQDPNTVFRFDAADLMPAVVGSGTYLTGMVDWVKGTPTPTILSRIDKSWPQ